MKLIFLISITAGLQGSSATHLIKYLQVSGVPAQNQSYLLDLLDVCAERNPDDLINLIFDTDHFIQLVELAQSRGAEGGETFCKLLESDYQKEDDAFTLEEIAADLPKIEPSSPEPSTITPPPPSSPPPRPTISKNELKSLMEVTFNPEPTSAPPSSSGVITFQQVKQKLSACVITKRDEDIAVANLLLDVLVELSSEKEKFLEVFCSNKREAVSLVQLLSRIEASRLVRLREFLKSVKDCEQQSCMLKNMVAKIFERLVSFYFIV